MLSDTLDLLLAGVACVRGAAYTAGGGALDLVAEHGLPREHLAALERLPLAGVPWFIAQRAAQQRKMAIDSGEEGRGGPIDRATLTATGRAHVVACPLPVGRHVHGAIVLTPEIASYLIRSRCPTLMRPIDLDQVRGLALRDAIAGRDTVGAPTLSARPPLGAHGGPPDPADSTERLVSRTAATTPSMSAVRAPPAPARVEGCGSYRTTMAPPPLRPPRPSTPPPRRATDAPPAESFRDQEFAAIAKATVTALRRDGPKRGGHVVAMLRARGLGETEALAVITFGLSSGVITRDPPPSTLLRASDAQRKRSVLVVDDDYDLREAMRDVLEEEGYLVNTASNGQEALDALRDGESPEVVVLDLMMPVMDGWHFLDELERDSALADIPVVVMSASQDGRGRPLGDKVFLSKPLDYHTLVATVARSLESRLGLT